MEAAVDKIDGSHDGSPGAETSVIPGLPPATEHSKNGICTLAPKRRWQDVGICRACLEQGLFDAQLAES